MGTTFDKPSLVQRILPLFRGFDGWLVGLVLLLAAAGLLAMYSSGYDHGTRFSDHGRNMLIAGGILFLLLVPLTILALLIALAGSLVLMAWIVKRLEQA